MFKKLLNLLYLAIVVAIPFIFRRSEVQLVPTNPDEVIVIITAHNETLRSEYGRGFMEWYRQKTGKTVTIDWRHPGGGRDVSRYIDSMFMNNFRFHWEHVLQKTWGQKERAIFAQLENIKKDDPDPIARELKETFLASDIGCGVDLLFGGGVFDHKVQGAKGYTVPSGFIALHPELFNDDAIPEFFAGERLWDADSRWIGGSLSSFGIIYNSDAVRALGTHPPITWMDLADPRYIGGIAIVDPTKSSSTLKSYEMLIQQQMQIAYARSGDESQAIREGWLAGLQLIQKIVANGRYMTDSSAQTVLDVSEGNCPVGIATDFYGRSEQSNIAARGGKPRFHFVIPQAGCSPSPDPISLYRGAKHRELAIAFLEYVLTLPGQQLLAYKVGVPGGPQHTPLCRAPILKTVYQSEFLENFDNPDVNPYREAANFTYREAWTKPVFRALGLIFKMAFLDPEDLLHKAWSRIQKAYQSGRHEDANRALAVMQNLELFVYDRVITEVMPETRNKDYLKAIQYQTDIANHFREQYRRAAEIAKGH